MKLIFFFFFCLLISCSPNAGEKSLYGLPVEKIDFHSFNIKSIEELPDELLGEEEYLFLTGENIEELFTEAEKIRIQDGRVFILDQRFWNHRLLVYDRDGKALGNVGRRGAGPGEYMHITDFDVTEDGTIYMLDAYKGNVVIHVYDRDFQFIRTIESPFQADCFACLPDNKFMFSLATWNNGLHAGDRILITDGELNVLDYVMEYNGSYDDNFWLSGYRLLKDREAEEVFLHRPVEDYVYVLDQQGKLKKIYEVDFGSYKVPLEARKEVEKYLPDFEQYKYLRDFVVINDRLMIGKMTDQRIIKYFVADRTTNTLYLSDNIGATQHTLLRGYENGAIISYLEPDYFTPDDARYDRYPEKVREHLATDNIVVCLRRIR